LLVFVHHFSSSSLNFSAFCVDNHDNGFEYNSMLALMNEILSNGDSVSF